MLHTFHHSSSQLSSSAQGMWLSRWGSKCCHCQAGDSQGWFLSSPLSLFIQLPCTGYNISPYTFMMTCCSEGSCPALAALPSPQILLLFLSDSQFKGKKTTPQQRGEGAGPQRGFPPVWYHLSSTVRPSREKGVNKALSLGSHHPPPMVGTSSGLGSKGREISLQLSKLLQWSDF